MKILALFIDMLGGEYMNVCNSVAVENEFDKLLRSLGGTIHTNCYCPAPDTPRASACMWTGVYPRKNGCTTRVKWPAKDLNPEYENLWKVLHDLGYNVNAFICKGTYDLGIIPTYGKECIFTDSIFEFFEKADTEGDSFNFFYLPDIHYILGETNYLGLDMATSFMTKIVEKIITHYGGPDYFDYIVMFSDHGFQSGHDEHFLSKERTHTFIYERERFEATLKFDQKLRTNMDLFPTICEKINYKIKNQVDGWPIFYEKEHEFVLQEEMNNLYVEISQSVEHWSVICADGSIHWVDCDGKWRHSVETCQFDEDMFLEIIKNDMMDYDRNHALYETSNRYREYTVNFKTECRYSTGETLASVEYRFIRPNELRNKKILLYGAGKVGQGYYSQLKQYGMITSWIDLNYVNLRTKVNPMISGVTTIEKSVFDVAIIALANYDDAKIASQLLTDLGVEKEKIVWEKPVFERIM